MEERKLSRKEREYLRHRKEILDAALELFSEKGFYETSMQEIAEKSEFSVGTLYKFFKNKDELYWTLVHEKGKEIHEEIMSVVNSAEGELSSIEEVLKAKIKVFMKNINFIRLYASESTGIRVNVKTYMTPIMKDLYENYLLNLAKIFERSIRKKNENIDPYCLAVTFDSIINSFLFLYLDDPEKYPLREDLIMEIFFENVLIGG
jgi:AcrR family transcriptional regulator